MVLMVCLIYYRDIDLGLRSKISQLYWIINACVRKYVYTYINTWLNLSKALYYDVQLRENCLTYSNYQNKTQEPFE